MKFCKDCRWYSAGDCYSPVNEVDLETGRATIRLARWSRFGDSDKRNNCGIDAKYFESKLPLWTKIKEYFK